MNATATAVPSGEESYISKLTIKTLGCVPARVTGLPDGEDKLALCRIFGKAVEVGAQEDKFTPGNFVSYFKGNFEGINMQTGETYRSGKLYLPKGISEIVEAAVKTMREKDEATASVSFAFELRSVKASNPIGYSYEAVALRKPEAEDELAEIRRLVMEAPTMENKKLAGGKVIEQTPALSAAPAATQQQKPVDKSKVKR